MSFKEFLVEKGSISKFEKSSSLIISYLQKNLKDVQRMPGIEKFSGEDSGLGLRYFYGLKSFRINYKGSSPSSIDVWKEGGDAPDYRILLSKISIVKALPTIVKILKSPAAGDFKVEEGISEAIGDTIHVIQAPQSAPVTDEPTAFETQIEDLKQLLHGVLTKNLSNSMIITGRGGVGKTHNVEKIISEIGLKQGKGYNKVTGSLSPVNLYKMLFDYRNGVVFIDDADSIFDSQEGRNILKSATDTKKVRTVSWSKQANWVYNPDKIVEDVNPSTDPDSSPSADGDKYEKFNRESDAIHRRLEFNKNQKKVIKDPGEKKSAEQRLIDAGKYPNRFDFTGKVIAITNLPIDKVDPDGALRTRGFIIEVSPSDDEVIKLMRKIVGGMDLEDGMSLALPERIKVIELLEKHPTALNMRKLQRGLNMLAAGLSNWQSLLLKYG